MFTDFGQNRSVSVEFVLKYFQENTNDANAI